MTRMLPAAVIVALGGLPAFAVDVVNKDNRTHELSVMTEGGVRKVVIKAGATLSDICDACQIMLPNDSIEASGDQVVIIQANAFLPMR
ncbi:MAG: hypothetical protein AB7G39_04140 [Alphaproteobacteria bacterium]